MSQHRIIDLSGNNVGRGVRPSSDAGPMPEMKPHPSGVKPVTMRGLSATRWASVRPGDQKPQAAPTPDKKKK